MKRLLLLVFSVLMFLTNINQVFAQPAKTVYSITNGASWTNGANWSLVSGGAPCSCIPDESKDNIQVQTNTSSATGLIFGASVTLSVSNNSTLTINGNTQFNNGSIVTVSTGSAIIINGNLDNQNNSNQIVFNGTLSVNGNFTGGTGSTLSGTGSMTTTGTATTTGTGSVFGSVGDCAVGPCVASVAAPLPIELLSFEAEPNGKVIELKWTTASEINNDYFSIEKTLDGSNFETIEKVNGAGNTSSVSNYSTTDAHPYDGVSYYRLRQTDYNGSFTLSNLVAIEFKNNLEFSFNAFPNPNDGSLINLDLTAAKGDQVLVVVYDAIGKESYSKVIVTEDNGKQVYAIDPSQKLTPGIYLITGTNNQELFSKKLIVK